MPTAALMTIDDFLKLPAGDCRKELVRGRVIESRLPTWKHARACFRLATRLAPLEERGDWMLCGRCGVVVQREPDSVRGPDLVIYERGKLTADHGGYSSSPPLFAAEVLDHDDRWLDMMEKGLELLHLGVKAVALVDPFHSSLALLRDHRPPQLYHNHDAFSLPELFGDYQFPVSEIFVY